jgi:hypothetical protein
MGELLYMLGTVFLLLAIAGAATELLHMVFGGDE